jgi:nicotinamide riboside transporter PnuC
MGGAGGDKFPITVNEYLTFIFAELAFSPDGWLGLVGGLAGILAVFR